MGESEAITRSPPASGSPCPCPACSGVGVGSLYIHTPEFSNPPPTEPCAAHPLLLHMTKGASSTRTLRRRRRGCVLVPTARASVNDAVSSYCLLCAVRAHLSFFCLCALPCGPRPDQGIYFWGTIEMPRCPALVPVSESAPVFVYTWLVCVCICMWRNGFMDKPRRQVVWCLFGSRDALRNCW